MPLNPLPLLQFYHHHRRQDDLPRRPCVVEAVTYNTCIPSTIVYHHQYQHSNFDCYWSIEKYLVAPLPPMPRLNMCIEWSSFRKGLAYNNDIVVQTRCTIPPIGIITTIRTMNAFAKTQNTGAHGQPRHYSQSCHAFAWSAYQHGEINHVMFTWCWCDGYHSRSILSQHNKKCITPAKIHLYKE